MRDRKNPRIWTTKTFDRLSPYYDRFMKLFFPIGETGREKIVEKLTTGTLLDVACGTGTLLAMAREKGLKCYGVDLSGGMLAQAQRKVPNAEFQRGSFYRLPYAEGSFDQVVATNALSGDAIDAGEALREMVRVCKTGGRIYIAEWPKTDDESITEKIVIWLASLNDDAPQDYFGMFREMGYEPEVDALDKRYHIFAIRK
ncbi:MAG: class I SAM-dependent methyltransferase [Anaerolineales bacterium]